MKMILLKFMCFFIINLVNINCDEYTTPDIRTTEYLTPSDEFDEMDFIPEKSIYNLVRGSTVDMWISQNNVVYCKLISLQGHVYYDNFGRCRLSLDRVGLEHNGNWEMHVGYAVKPTLDVKTLSVYVIEPDSKTKVRTSVEESSPNIMTITCSLPSGYQLHGCKFRGPHDMMLVASGTTENNIIINTTIFESHLVGSECSFQILNPRVRDLGYWRCAMYTEQDTYYGFFTILSSWLLHETSVVSTIRQGPMLRTDHGSLVVNQGEPVTMSCSIDAPIRYCYFWMSDGTIFNVSPGLKSSSMEYAGSGFDAGECGLKLYDLSYRNINRRWSCNVALALGSQQSREFWVNIRDRMQVSQYNSGTFTMTVSGQITNFNGQLEYCRFVQDGGFGFSHDMTHSRYEFVGSLSKGYCALEIQFPSTWSDYSPWTIVAKVVGEDEEISGRTRGLPIPNNQQYVGSSDGWYVVGWVFLAVVIAGILLAVSVGPQRNRNWISRRATIVRQSLRRQQPPPYTPTN